MTDQIITNGYLRNMLEELAQTIMCADGDRDYMNPSDLTVQQTTSAAAFMRLAAERIPIGDAQPRPAHPEHLSKGPAGALPLPYGVNSQN